MERNRTRNLAFTILIGDTFCQSLLYIQAKHEKGQSLRLVHSSRLRTLVKTAIEAYELPKLMPTTGGRVELGAGFSVFLASTTAGVWARDVLEDIMVGYEGTLYFAFIRNEVKKYLGTCRVT
jgi:hypothetical protein